MGSQHLPHDSFPYPCVHWCEQEQVWPGLHSWHPPWHSQGERQKEVGSNSLEENCHIEREQLTVKGCSVIKRFKAGSCKTLNGRALICSLSQHEVLPLFPRVPPFSSTWQAAEGRVFLFIYDLQVWSRFQEQPVCYAPLKKKSRWR